MVTVGEPIYAGDALPLAAAMKASSTARASTTTVADDPDLALTLGPGTWDIAVRLRYNGDSGADLKVRYGLSGVTAVTRECVGPPVASTDVNSTSVNMASFGTSTEVVYGCESTSSNAVLREWIVVTVATAGTITLQWAQNSTSTTATTVLSGSRMIATRIA